MPDPKEAQARLEAARAKLRAIDGDGHGPRGSHERALYMNMQSLHAHSEEVRAYRDMLQAGGGDIPPQALQYSIDATTEAIKIDKQNIERYGGPSFP